MSEDVYTRLRDFMDELPAGYPSTPTGVEIKILKKMFTPEQAELTMKLRNEPEEVPAIAARIGIGQAELGPRLEEMAQKGCIFRVRRGGERLYQAFQFVIGLYEFQLDRIDREYSELLEEYLPYLGLSMMSVKTRQLRVIPLESSIESTPEVATYNRVRDLVREQETISVAQCICRKEQGLLGHPCDRPQEVCLTFGDYARYYIDNGMGRKLSVEEALGVLDLAEEHGLVVSPTNTQKIAAICCCCPCCCPNLKTARASERPLDFVLSYYQARIDADQCSSCGLCLDRCQVDAIEEGEDTWSVLEDRCIGCGLCVAECPTEAISMLARPGMAAPPESFDDLIGRIGAERGVS
jgi:ferredoxin